jgi:acetylornithine deacetylase
LIESILENLAALVACDTQNPPRAITPQSPLYRVLDAARSSDFDVQTIDHGRGRVTWFAQRGTPRVLFNVHLDTVPASSSWSGDPLKLEVRGGRAIGLGACDIKGAAACLLTLASKSDVDLALLFTSDEEGGESCCVAKFIEANTDSYRLVVVAEPTAGRAVFGHRGYVSQRGTFAGASGHTSRPAGQRQSAVHQLIRWGSAALAQVAEAEKAAGNGADFCFNLGTVAGGIKGNMVADRAEVRWSARLPPGEDEQSLLDRLNTLPGAGDAVWETTFRGPSFPRTGQLRSDAQQYVAALGLAAAPDVEFWTEAAWFSRGNWPALVLGPGEIAHAHAPGEWVALDQLQLAYDQYLRIAHVD